MNKVLMGAAFLLLTSGLRAEEKPIPWSDWMAFQKKWAKKLTDAEKAANDIRLAKLRKQMAAEQEKKFPLKKKYTISGEVNSVKYGGGYGKFVISVNIVTKTENIGGAVYYLVGRAAFCYTDDEKLAESLSRDDKVTITGTLISWDKETSEGVLVKCGVSK
jgi:hypothetical protein